MAYWRNSLLSGRLAYPRFKRSNGLRGPSKFDGRSGRWPRLEQKMLHKGFCRQVNWVEGLSLKGLYSGSNGNLAGVLPCWKLPRSECLMTAVSDLGPITLTLNNNRITFDNCQWIAECVDEEVESIPEQGPLKNELLALRHEKRKLKRELEKYKSQTREIQELRDQWNNLQFKYELLMDMWTLRELDGDKQHGEAPQDASPMEVPRQDTRMPYSTVTEVSHSTESVEVPHPARSPEMPHSARSAHSEANSSYSSLGKASPHKRPSTRK